MRALGGIACAFAVAAVVASAATAFGFADDSRILPSGTAGSAYRAQLHGRNGCPPYSYHLSGGATLPSGVGLLPDGSISGTPVAAGKSDFWLAVSDSCGGESQMPFSIAVVAAPPPAEVGIPFRAALVATGAPDDRNAWRVVSGIVPPGLSLDPSGAITGTPASSGSFPLELGVFNPGHLTEPLPGLELTLKIASLPTIAAARLAPARVSRAYRARLAARGGTEPLRWAVIHGAGILPVGIRLDTRTGVLVGTARERGTYRFTVSATDRFRQTSTRRLTLTVRAATAR